MNRFDKLEQYKPLVDFLAQVLGNNCEVVLHDLMSPDKSIVKIANGHISGREMNGPLTDLALKVLQEKTYKNKDYICNYKGTSKDDRVMRSSSYFIKDDDNEIIGMLCINIDISDMIRARDFIDDFVKIPPCKEEKKDSTPEDAIAVFESFAENIEDLISSLIQKVLSEYPISPERMSLEEKQEVVKKLNDKGVFLLKGGVGEVAKSLKTSETTIYRYISKIK